MRLSHCLYLETLKAFNKWLVHYSREPVRSDWQVSWVKVQILRQGLSLDTVYLFSPCKVAVSWCSRFVVAFSSLSPHFTPAIYFQHPFVHGFPSKSTFCHVASEVLMAGIIPPLAWTGGAHPVQSWLIHALGVLFQLALAVRPQALNVGRQMRHVGDPGHRSLVEGRRGQGRLRSLERHTVTNGSHYKLSPRALLFCGRRNGTAARRLIAKYKKQQMKLWKIQTATEIKSEHEPNIFSSTRHGSDGSGD